MFHLTGNESSGATARLLMSSLANAARAVIDPDKFTKYCLDPRSRQGRHKARVFKAALGYDLSNYTDIREGILEQHAEYQGETAHGRRWRVDLPISGPHGRAKVRTSWLYEGGNDVPRLTTAYVIGKR
jgi:hypothetical protein